MKQVNQQNYAICSLLTSTVGPQFFGVERSNIDNKELSILPSRPVSQIPGSIEWCFTRSDDQVFGLSRENLEVLSITGFLRLPIIE